MRLIYLLVLGAGLAVSPAAQAQFAPEPRYDPRTVNELVDRVHADLSQAYERHHFSDSDRERLDKAGKQLREFAKKWDDGKFDKDQLDEAIRAIQKVLDDNKLKPDVRQALD